MKTPHEILIDDQLERWIKENDEKRWNRFLSINRTSLWTTIIGLIFCQTLVIGMLFGAIMLNIQLKSIAAILIIAAFFTIALLIQIASMRSQYQRVWIDMIKS